MFKKFRNNKNLSNPPAAPTVDEILSDLETFQVQSQITKKTSSNDDTMDVWWDAFEHFVDGHNELKNMDNDISNTKHKLEKYKNELESNTQTMKKEISTQKELITIE